MSILFKNAQILVKDDGKTAFLRDAYLGVKGTQIVYVGVDAPEEQFAETMDMSGKLLIPGLINAHSHAPMTLLRGVGSGLPLQSWLFNAIFPLEDKMTADDVRIGEQFAIMEMLSSGTTCFQEMYWDQAQLIDMVLETGIKINTGAVITDPVPDAAWSRNFAFKRLDATEQFYKGYHMAGDGRVHANMQLHSEYLSSPDVVYRASQMLHDYDMELHTHISETKNEHEECLRRHGKTPIGYFNYLGLLDTGAVCAHCVWVTKADLNLMASKHATIAHNPTSNMKLGSGIAPIARAVQKGVNVTIGTDGVASNNNLNMFEEMHIAALLQLGANSNPTIITAEQAFDMATVNAAFALHRDDTGVLDIGMKADIVAIDLDKPHLIPDNDTLSLLVYSAQGSDVWMTMVDGRILYKNGEYYSIDAEKCTSEFKRTVKDLFAR